MDRIHNHSPGKFDEFAEDGPTAEMFIRIHLVIPHDFVGISQHQDGARWTGDFFSSPSRSHQFLRQPQSAQFMKEVTRSPGFPLGAILGNGILNDWSSLSATTQAVYQSTRVFLRLILNKWAVVVQNPSVIPFNPGWLRTGFHVLSIVLSSLICVCIYIYVFIYLFNWTWYHICIYTYHIYIYTYHVYI